jgi:hypothetical protein
MKPMTQDNDYDCCEAVVPTLSKVLENFNEVVMRLEHKLIHNILMYCIWPVLRLSTEETL